MEAERAIITRRIVKHYDPAHKMSDEEIKKLLSLASLSPTAFNIQNWCFVVISDSALRRLKFPCDHVISIFVAIGKGIKEVCPSSGQLALDEIVIENSFG